ncbi:hypothetical protein ACC796_37010, partial [Rhizobium ruizarguesonis]
LPPVMIAIFISVSFASMAGSYGKQLACTPPETASFLPIPAVALALDVGDADSFPDFVAEVKRLISTYWGRDAFD